jgi:hypothetical protein
VLTRHIAPAVALAAALGLVVPASAQVPIPGPSLPVPAPTGSVPGVIAPIAPSSAPQRAAQPPGSCTVEGTNGSDRLTGTAEPDFICGEGGDDVLEGLEGDDVLDGGPGLDTATWESSACCVFADLGSDAATGFQGADQLVEIERLTGSQGADVLRGDEAANILIGNAATDLMYGGEGDDALIGGDGDDWLAGGGGTNILDGGFGANVCADGAGALCDQSDPGDPADARGPLDVSLVDGSFGGGSVSFRVAAHSRLKAASLWDQGYVVISFDSRGGEELDVHAVVAWSKTRPSGLLIVEGSRKPSGRLAASRAGSRAVTVKLPLSRLRLDPLRLYYRWSASSIFTGSGCRPCLDGVPDTRAYPQPLI